MTYNRFLTWALWATVVASALTAVGTAYVLLRGDPTYLVQQRTRDGQPYGEPAPVSFPSRAFATTLLVGGLGLAVLRALSDATSTLRLPIVVGLALWLTDAAVFAGTRPLFPAALALPWFVLPLLLVLYAEPISEFLGEYGPAPAWAFWGLGLVVLAFPIGSLLFFRGPQ